MEEKGLITFIEPDSQDLYDTCSVNSANQVTAIIMQDDTIALEDIGDEPDFKGSQNFAVAVLVPTSSSGWEPNIEDSTVGKKYLWRPVYGPKLCYASGAQTLVYEVLDEYVGFPDDVLTSISVSPPLRENEEEQSSILRGVFYPNYQRKVLFSKTLTLQTNKLPRWKPHATIQMRTYESEEK